ncbi:SPFH domain-containing protein [Caldichromatium japonicum]|uniref:SPFH domain-containing protein n=1 Tax=Caldichromatium japonicum TaxID=2699430 RepID=UPI002483CDB6|nr:SPFH domain-containing protein [Caldichromatium japonicum]
MQVTAFLLGLLIFVIYRLFKGGIYTVKPDERAAITTLGRAQRLGHLMVEDPAVEGDERASYRYPGLRVIGPGGPYFKWPWQEVHKVRVVTQAIDLTWDPTKTQSTIEAVTKDNLTIGVSGQIRFRVAENNLYAYLLGVDSPLEHVMGYFISVLRERIANFVDPKAQTLGSGPDTNSIGPELLAVVLSFLKASRSTTYARTCPY